MATYRKVVPTVRTRWREAEKELVLKHASQLFTPEQLEELDAGEIMAKAQMVLPAKRRKPTNTGLAYELKTELLKRAAAIAPLLAASPPVPIMAKPILVTEDEAVARGVELVVKVLKHPHVRDALIELGRVFQKALR